MACHSFPNFQRSFHYVAYPYIYLLLFTNARWVDGPHAGSSCPSSIVGGGMGRDLIVLKNIAKWLSAFFGFSLVHAHEWLSSYCIDICAQRRPTGSNTHTQRYITQKSEVFFLLSYFSDFHFQTEH